MRPIQAPRPLAEDAADRIREEIQSGRLGSGERLVESRIAPELHISRGPEREAFKLLRAEGLLVEQPRRGTFVVQLGPGDVRDLYDVRAAVEARAARLVARRRDERDLVQLRARLDALIAAAAAGDPREVSRAELEFHDTVSRLARNERLHAVYSGSVSLLRTVTVDERRDAASADVAEEHRPLLQAIEDGDGDEAARRFEAHVERAAGLAASQGAAASR